MIIYRAVNTKNGKWYVGSTKDFEERKRSHLESKAKTPFHNALRKCPKSFIWEVLEEYEGEDREPEQIILDCWWGTKYCYNVSSSATGFNSDMARKAANARTEEGKKQGGRVSGPRVGRETHINHPEKMIENGKNTLALLIERNPNHQSDAGKIGGKTGSREKKKVGGLKCKENGLGMFAIPPEERSKISRENALKVCRQKWMDPDHPELGEHNAGVLASMQKRRNLPHGKENRVRIS